MGPVQTLHEFALNLLNDPQSLAEYKADPQGVLNGAGLGELNPSDVQDIMPLVMDSAPLPAAPAVPAVPAVPGVPAAPSIPAVPGVPAAPSIPAVPGVPAAPSVPSADLGGAFDQANSAAEPVAHQVGDGLGGLAGALPNLSPVFEGVSNVADATGLNTVTHGALGAVSGVLDHVAEATHSVPVVGPIVDAAAIDTQNTVNAVGEHVFDGKLVGSAVDATTNHLGDALTWKAVVAESGKLPVVGGPVSGIVEDVRQGGSHLLGTVNEAIGSTPVGVHEDSLRADLTQATGDLTQAGDLSGTLDHATGAVPGLPAVPAVPGAGELPQVPGVGSLPQVPGVGSLPAVPGAGELPQVPGVGALPAAPSVPGVGELPHAPALPAAPNAGSLTHAIEGATAHAPAVNAAAHHVTNTVQDAVETGTQHATTGELPDASHAAPVLNEVQNHLHDVAGGLESHASNVHLDSLHLGH
ncbi:IniB N-terminal domain-containing protein [Amycolatopsis sp. CFH S0740]|uniref:IniB N-terminal domain-containing protein n=1 Tax=Amycolatopsis sp. CFH S0740 TaxID=1644111 RepID=UPI00196BAD12|nr:IniB N-terminal domain-containing protein [Amycolatopsis sp. CFH S0740]